MIGAAAMVGPSSGVAATPARANTSTGVDAASAGANAASPRTSPAVAANPASADASSTNASTGAEASPVNAAVKRDAAQDGQARDGAMSSGFAALLAAASTGEAPTLPATALLAAQTESNATDPATTTGLPEQLLVLLSGNWAMPMTPPGEPAPTGTAVALPTPSPVSTLPASAPGTPDGGLPIGVAPPITDGAAPSANGNASEALAELAAGALNATSERASDSGALAVDAAPSFDNLVLAAAGPTAAATRPNAAAPTAPLALPVDPDAGFDDGFGARIAWMAEQRVGHAQIRLNPEHVGPIEVHVQLDGTRVSAEFTSSHAEVRQAIEASMPRLREMLGQQGLQLGQADVGRRQSGQGQALGEGASAARDNGAGEEAAVAMPPLRSRGLLDEYA